MLKESPSENLEKYLLSNELEQVVHTLSQKESITYDALLQAISDRSQALEIFILCLPLLIPTPIPGIPIPCGLLIAILGFRMAFGLGMWTPKNWRGKPLSKGFSKLLKKSLRIVRWSERWVYPRLAFFSKHPWIERCNGFLIGLCGLVIAVPLPPGTNVFPAVAIFLLALGSLENDGVCICLGYIALLLNIFFFSSLFIALWSIFIPIT